MNSMTNTEHVTVGKSLLRDPVDIGSQDTPSVEQIVKNAILGNSHPTTDGWYLAFLNEDEVNTVANQVVLAIRDRYNTRTSKPKHGEQHGHEKLNVIGELIRTQDNRITDQPMFIVQQKREYVCDEERTLGFYSTRHAWINTNEGFDVDEKKSARLEAAFKKTYGSKPKKHERICLGTIWEFVTACFTEQGCKDYLAINGHNLNEPRIYADGSCRNEEFRTIRNFIKNLPSPVEAAK